MIVLPAVPYAKRLRRRPGRIATFDNDGTLWTEHPIYTEVMYTLERIKTLAPAHRE